MSINLQKELLAGGSTVGNMNKWWTAEEAEKEAKLTYRDAVVTQIHTTTQAYRGLVSDKLTLNNDASTLASDNLQLKNAKLELKLGRGTQYAVNQSALDVSEAESTLVTDKQTIASARVTLNEALGLDPAVVLHVANHITEPTIHLIPLEKAEQRALKTSAAYQTAEIAVTQAKRALAIARNANLPSLTFGTTASVGGSHQPSDVQSSLKWGIPIDNIPGKVDVIKARITVINAQQSLTTARNKVLSDTTLDYNSLTSAIRTLKLSQQTYALNKETVAQQYAEYKAGDLDLFTYSTAKQALTTTRNDLQSSQNSLWSNVETYRTDIGTVLTTWGIVLHD
jgi:outer membrane protein TolC